MISVLVLELSLSVGDADSISHWVEISFSLDSQSSTSAGAESFLYISLLYFSSSLFLTAVSVFFVCYPQLFSTGSVSSNHSNH